MTAARAPSRVDSGAAMLAALVVAAAGGEARADVLLDLRGDDFLLVEAGPAAGSYLELIEPLTEECLATAVETPADAGSLLTYLVSRDAGASWEYWRGAGWTTGAAPENAIPIDVLSEHLRELDPPGRLLLRIFLNGPDTVVETLLLTSCKCGDRHVDARVEQCDDGATQDMDGCDAHCRIEPGFACVGEPSRCSPVCGNGVVNTGESCDDGNLAAGDGCSPLCWVERGYSCVGSPSTCAATCGDGTLNPGETCDDGNTTGGDGCGGACWVVRGWQCQGRPSQCAPLCGDGAVDAGEQCDDGNIAAGDGCSPACTTEPGWACSGEPSACTPGCGDGRARGAEECDDGNRVDGDGCAAWCGIEPGWSCIGQPSMCLASCGNGAPDFGEECDDANVAAGDGCTHFCNVEPGYTCVGAPSDCQGTCGDGVVSRGEQCDDGGERDGDGCSAHCAVEPGAACEGEPSSCAFTCGDGRLDPGEQCDDNNVEAGDGCTAICRHETGHYCAGEPSACTTRCGDGRRAGVEECDDGNMNAGDGCDGACRVESGWSCTAGQACTPQCGDGRLVGEEQCDDGNVTAWDGCSEACAMEEGWQCTGEPSACTFVPADGGTIVEPDGDEQAGDGDGAAAVPGDGDTAPPGDMASGLESGDAGAAQSLLAGRAAGGALGCMSVSPHWLAVLAAAGSIMILLRRKRWAQRSRRAGSGPVAALVIVATALPARAQDVDLQLFRPAPAFDGMSMVRGGSVSAPLVPVVSLTAVVAKNPLVLRAHGSKVTGVVSERVDLVIAGALGLVPGVDIAFAIPTVPYQHESATVAGDGFVAADRSSAGVGDPRVEARAQLLSAASHGLDLAAATGVSFPLGAGPAFARGGQIGLVPEVQASRRLGRVLLAADLGFQLTGPDQVSDIDARRQLLWAAGAGVELTSGDTGEVFIATELYGRTPVARPFADQSSSPAEVLLSGRFRVGDLLLTAGGGAGLARGWGAPLWRGIAAVAWAPAMRGSPAIVEPSYTQLTCPGGGVADADGACPPSADPPERTDEQGVPDAVLDGILDPGDTGPDEAEDGDGILDTDDTCLDEDGDSFAGADGCLAVGEQLVQLAGDAIEIRGVVFFGVGDALLRRRARAALDQVAALLLNHREITRVRVEGYADSTGSARRNLQLSRGRARQVRRYLVRHGVDAGRLEIVGHGATDPTERRGRAGPARERALSRRVELTVVERGAKALSRGPDSRPEATTPRPEAPPPSTGR